MIPLLPANYWRLINEHERKSQSLFIFYLELLSISLFPLICYGINDLKNEKWMGIPIHLSLISVLL
jgi:hypothetical protein